MQFDQVVDTFTADTRTSNRRLLDRAAPRASRATAPRRCATDYRALPGALREGAVDARGAARLGRPRPRDVHPRPGPAVRDAVATAARQLDTLLATYRTTLDALGRRQALAARDVPALERLLTSAPRFAAARPLGAARGAHASPRPRAPALEIAPPVLDHANAFVAELRTLMGADRLDRIITELGPVTARLLELEQSLPELFGLVDRVSGCVRDKVLPVLNTQVDDGHLSTGQPVWQDLIHGAQGLLSSQQNFGGDGYSTRFSFGVDQTVVATRAGVGDLVQLTGSPHARRAAALDAGPPAALPARRPVRDAAGAEHEGRDACRRPSRSRPCG